MRVRLSELPHELTLEEAVDAAYADVLEELVPALRREPRVLLETDSEVMPFLYRALRGRLQAEGGDLRLHYAAGKPAATQLGPLELEVRTSYTEQLRRDLDALVRLSDPNLLVVAPHFELLAATPDGAPSRETRELRALLDDHPEARLLALHAPGVRLPSLATEGFRARGGLGEVPLDRLRSVVLQREARKLAVDTFDPEAFHAAVGPLDVVALRRVLSGLHTQLDFDPRTPETRGAVLEQLARSARAREDAHGIPDPRPAPGAQEWVLRERRP